MLLKLFGAGDDWTLFLLLAGDGWILELVVILRLVADFLEGDLAERFRRDRRIRAKAGRSSLFVDDIDDRSQ